MGPPKNGREINVGPKDNLLSHPPSSTQQKERKKKGKIGAGKIITLGKISSLILWLTTDPYERKKRYER